jgi:hypothetical protein
MHFPRLDLNGIRIGKPTNTPDIKQTVKISINPSSNNTQIHKPKPGRKTKLLRLLRKAKLKARLAGIVLICVTALISTYILQHKHTHRILRKIQKVPCRNINGLFVCKSKYSTGTMMISVKPECKRYIYEINHIPFTDISDWHKNTISVAAQKIMTIKDAKPTCELSMHRITTPYKPKRRTGIVWITTKKHTEFTMTIGNTIVLDQTPTDFIDSQSNGEWVAYNFDPETINIDKIQITGDAADAIHIYT